MDDLGEVLEKLRSSLAETTNAETIKEAAEPFCDDFYRLYWLYCGKLSRSEMNDVLSFLKDSAPKLEGAMRFILQDLLNRITLQIEQSYQGLEWIRLCEMRSTLDAFDELYEDHMAVSLMMPDLDDIEAVDDQISLKGEIEARIHPTLTPSNFPDTHWWWDLEA